MTGWDVTLKLGSAWNVDFGRELGRKGKGA